MSIKITKSIQNNSEIVENRSANNIQKVKENSVVFGFCPKLCEYKTKN